MVNKSQYLIHHLRELYVGIIWLTVICQHMQVKVTVDVS